MNIYNDEGITKRDCDIVYGAFTVGAALLCSPIAIASLGMWYADRKHYPSHNTQSHDQNNQDTTDPRRSYQRGY
tara:strand:+ start:72 stop:293 length:222 start_codon:yes stop_codon:yes gene_type:complete